MWVVKFTQHTNNLWIIKSILRNTGKGNTEFLSTIHSVISFFQKNELELHICEEFHISLSRTFILRHHWIEGFVSSLKNQLKDFKRFKDKSLNITSQYVNIPVFLLYRDPFQIIGKTMCTFINEEKTRTFVGEFLRFKKQTIVEINALNYSSV